MSQTEERGDVLLTGATGFLGMELLSRYLEGTSRNVIAPVRAGNHAEANTRIRRVLELLFGRADAYQGRVLAIPADVECEGLGLSPADDELVSSQATEIVHSAATVSFEAELEESRRINVGGTRNVLQLAGRCIQRGPMRRFTHISTAYVAGTHRGVFGEEDLDVGQGFRNSYERSKYEAERLVRRHAGELPTVTILRPSIIVGDSRTGWTPAFNVLYAPLRAFAARQLRVLPARPSAPVDVVPVDHVADAIIELTSERDEGLSTYHLVAGERATTVKELVDLSAGLLHRRAPPIVPPQLYRAVRPLLVRCGGRRRRAAVRRAAPFLPYYTMDVRYRRDLAARRLDPVGLRPPALHTYYDRLLHYATAAHWGKRPLPRYAAQSADVVPVGR
jgi:long-chain acyl-CoA synthetase